MVRSSLGYSPLAAAVLALCALGPASGNAATTSPAAPTITTAPIFLPDYDKSVWSALRGSILSSNKTASQTTYTIFCPEQPPGCELSLDFPFVFAEGPETLEFHGTLTSSYIVDLGCKLDGTTVATCSGYSSLAAGYTNGQNTGPMESSWTSTLSGSHVQWGTLTLADKPTTTDVSSEPSAISMPAPTVPSSVLSHPTATTTKGAGASMRADGRMAIMAVGASLLAAAFII